ncbi:hypothetical protein Daus18300_001129 [Diaporthe australafricana]|uniref:Uncharacterized protein n=1 Tax=Diaporthe australafricana TaxID=127596 RepID=A0ABR3Y0G8_9PEZI
MPSSKGKPTDPELREEIKEGKWMLPPASKLAKEYEKQGGGYENEEGSKNEPKKGEPEPKSDSKKKKETED